MTSNKSVVLALFALAVALTLVANNVEETSAQWWGGYGGWPYGGYGYGGWPYGGYGGYGGYGYGW
jgi:outer membrane protein insertion porin family